MALQDVKNDILREAREKADKIEQETDAELEEIISEAEEKAEEIKEEVKEEIEEDKESERKKVVSNARMKARQKKLEAKQDKIQQAFDNLGEELDSLTDDEKSELVKNACEQAEFEVSKIKASSDFEDVVDGRKYDLEESDVDGFVLVSEGGERSKNYSKEKIVEDLKSRYRKEVAKSLFGEVDE